MPLIAYNETDDPTENGVYACRVPKGNMRHISTPSTARLASQDAQVIGWPQSLGS